MNFLQPRVVRRSYFKLTTTVSAFSSPLPIFKFFFCIEVTSGNKNYTELCL